jgi:hypothetical protein
VVTFSCYFSFFALLFCLHLSVQALGWQATAGRTSMQRCAASTQWFNERISLARYAHVRILYCHPSELFQIIWKWLRFFFEINDLYINSYLNRCHWETLNLIGFFLLLMCSSQGHCTINSRFVFISSWCNQAVFCLIWPTTQNFCSVPCGELLMLSSFCTTRFPA